MKTWQSEFQPNRVYEDFSEVVGDEIISGKLKSNNMNLQGKKTYLGLVVIFLGWLGIGDWISEEQVGEAINLIVQLVGIVVAVYGNHKAHKQIAKLGGY